MTKDWAVEELSRAQAMWMDGNSAGVIASVLGRSRSSVIGKISRMGWQRDGASPRIQLERAATIARRRERANGAPRIASQKTAAVDLAAARALLPLGSSAIADRGCCKFLWLEHAHCCNRPIEQPGKRYCDAHCAVMYSRAVAA